MDFDGLAKRRGAAATALAVLACAGLASCGPGPQAPAPAKPSSGPPSVELSPEQLLLIRVGTVAEQDFAQQVETVGSIDFDEDRTVQVFSPYQGKIIQTYSQLGDDVRQGQPLFTVESPDLMAAGSTLISAEATETANARALDRARKLHETQGISEQNLEAAVSAEASSNAALQAARAAISVFGKSPAKIEAMARHGHADPVLVVRSPIGGKVTARNAQPGLLVQPGTAPAPFVVGDTSTMWMIANAPEDESALFHVGQPVEASVPALPGRVLAGKVEAVGANVDSGSHTVQLRASIHDPEHLLKSGMQASFVIQTGPALRSAGIPADGVVREGDGTLTAWVTRDRHHFVQRVIKVGLMRGGYDQVLSGVSPGEQVVTKGAVYLDNMLTATPDND